MDGQENTRQYIKLAEEIGEKYDAVQFCAYKIDGNKKWYLPALGELNVLYNNLTDVQNTLSETPNASQISDKTYWSSSNGEFTNIYTMNFSTSNIRSAHVVEKCNVRCFAHF